MCACQPSTLSAGLLVGGEPRERVYYFIEIYLTGHLGNDPRLVKTAERHGERSLRRYTYTIKSVRAPRLSRHFFEGGVS